MAPNRGPPRGEGGRGVDDAEPKHCLKRQLKKTKMCLHFEKGECKFGSRCSFAHSEDEIQDVPDLTKTRICEAFENGKCDNENCSFAHGADELRSTDIFYKRTLCIWHDKGTCRAGDECRFAHGEDDLRGDAKQRKEAAEAHKQGKKRQME